ncbi:MAG TPA: hypothetical protein VFD70_15170 [Anaerolineae bacterium]|nr:hypothetical protein [Anaerolineae bacterium]
MTTAELAELGTVIVNDAQARGMTMRMCGGVAIYLRCPSIETHLSLQRANVDLDLVVAADAWSKLDEIFAERGFSKKADSANAKNFVKDGIEVETQGTKYHEDFTLDLSERLTVTPLTLPLADLLLIKLARVNFREKEIQDCAALLVDHRVTNGGEEEEDINREYLYHLVNQEYRLWKTVFDNTVTLEKVFDKYLEPEEAQLAWRRIELLQEVFDGKSHSLNWWAGRVLQR